MLTQKSLTVAEVDHLEHRDVSIYGVKQQRLVLENAVRDLLQQFESETGLNVRTMRLERDEFLSGFRANHAITEVFFEVVLP